MSFSCNECKSEIEMMGRADGLCAEARLHLEGCSACREFGGELAALRRLVGEMRRVEAPADFEFRLRTRLAAAGESRRRSWPGFSFSPGMAALACALLFAGVAGALYFRDARTPPELRLARTRATELNVAAPKKDGAPLLASKKVEGDAGRSEESLVGNVVVKPVSSSSFARRGMTRRPSAIAPVAEESATFSQRVAPILGADGLERTETAVPGTFAVPFKVSSGPLRIVLSDGALKGRVLPMRTVSFGAQDAVRQSNELPRAVPARDEGVW